MHPTYNAGDFLVITTENSEVQYEIIESSLQQVRLNDCINDVLSVRKPYELDELLVEGKLKISQKNKNTRKLLKSDAADFASYPEKDKILARNKFLVVREILEQKPKSYSESRISLILSEVFDSLIFEGAFTKPSARTVIRWIKAYIDSQSSIRGLLPLNSFKGNRNARTDPRIEGHIDMAVDHYKNFEQPSVAKSYDYLCTKIHFDNSQIQENKLKVPTYITFKKRLEKEAPKIMMAARRGKSAANIAFKTNRLPQDISLILQRVEADHTQLDIFIVDGKQNLVLGRPYITALLDYKSKSILGFYIGYESPSYLSIAQALRHAILPKTYVKEKYKDVENEWPCYGIPKVLVVDRGKDFESTALLDACMDLDIRIQRNPARHPWYKGSVESYFKSLNAKLLNDMKGKVFPNIVDSNEYNSAKNGVMTLDTFLIIFHIWVVDIYSQSKVSGGKIIPNISWLEDSDKVPQKVKNRDALDIILSEKTTRLNRVDGIQFDNIMYDSDALANLRAEIGYSKVNIKFDRNNLGSINVLDIRDKLNKKYFSVPAVNQVYANNLSLHQHSVIKKFNTKYLNSKQDLESLAIAKVKIQQLIKSNMNEKSGSIASNQKIARYAGLGQKTDQSVISSVEQGLIQTEYTGVPMPPTKESSRVTIDKIQKSPEFDTSLPPLENTLKIKRRDK